MDYYEAVASRARDLSAQHGVTRAPLANTDLTPWRSGLLAVASMGASSHRPPSLWTAWSAMDVGPSRSTPPT